MTMLSWKSNTLACTVLFSQQIGTWEDRLLHLQISALNLSPPNRKREVETKIEVSLKFEGDEFGGQQVFWQENLFHRYQLTLPLGNSDRS
jgi:hypothetical protein